MNFQTTGKVGTRRPGKVAPSLDYSLILMVKKERML